MEAYGALEFYINGRKVTESCPDPTWTLGEYLRNTLSLRGTKMACGQGACGSCTVMLSYYDKANTRIINKAVVSCILPLCSVHGCAITTVEGIGTTRTGLHEIQKRLMEGFGIQCGFCTPGMVMSMYALLRNQAVSKESIEKALEGNLCRCTGYRSIVQSFQSFDKDSLCSQGDKCCQNKRPPGPRKILDEKYEKKENRSAQYDQSQEPIFPSELQLSDQFSKLAKFKKDNNIWFHASSLEMLLMLRRQHPTALLTSGHTQSEFWNSANYSIVISLSGVVEMKRVKAGKLGLTLGAALSVNDAMDHIQQFIKDRPDISNVLSSVLTLFQKIGSQQIRNVVTLGGSLYAHTANSDVLVGLVAAGATITIVNNDGTTYTQTIESCFDDGDYKAPKRALILNIYFPIKTEETHVFCGRLSPRRTLSRAIVNAGLRMKIEEKTNIITEAVLCFGGIGKTVLIAYNTANAIIGREWNDNFFEDFCQELTSEMEQKAIGEGKEYRITLGLGFFFKFSHLVIQKQEADDSKPISPCTTSTIDGTRIYEEVPLDQAPQDSIGRPLPHLYSRQMATGEALYYSDLPFRSDEKFVAMVYSTKAHANILRVDVTAALSMEGVIGFVDHRDIPGSNFYHENKSDEIFATEKVYAVGQGICGIVANNEKNARKAVKAVQVEYEDLHHIVSIEEAIAQNSYYEEEYTEISRGDVEAAFSEDGHMVIEGTSRVSTQEHFYMETQTALIVPSGECDEYHVYVGSQSLQGSQDDVAAILGIPNNRIIVHHKRMGGAFGGKEGRSTSLVIAPAAVAAYKFGVPVRAMLTRTEDITTTNKRHPFLVNYKTRFDSDGKIWAIEQDAYLNSGSVVDYSSELGQRFLLMADGAYNVPNRLATLRLCKTNTPSPGAMRGFGALQAYVVSEDIINNIADIFGIPAEQVREKNLYEAGDCDITGSKIKEDYQLKLIWNKIKIKANVEERRKQQEDFNSQNRLKKRGFSMNPVKYGIGYQYKVLFQGAAHVMIYTDGSVLLAHGGTEMGQGIDTKMIQIASRELEIPVDKIHITETATNVIPNATMTAASKGNDIFGPAVIDACKKIMERLAPFKLAQPSGTWNEWVMAAYVNRVSLSATGFFRDELVKELYDFKTKKGTPFSYHTYGVVCTEVEVDILTGEHVCLQTDIIIDAGRSLNPGIDMGQIEGAFTQGMGYCTTEEIVRSPEGSVLTSTPETYFIPTVADVPRKMNVTILNGARNPAAIYSSRAIGEPPTLMGVSVFFAIKDAIRAARADNEQKGPFRLDCPATPQRIRMACCNTFTQMINGNGTKRQAYVPKWYQ